MPTTAERHALAFLAAVAVLGGGVRVVQARAFDRVIDQAVAAQGAPAPAATLERQLAAVEQARTARKAAARPAGPPAEPIDVDVATAEELVALPRVGPALAARIVADRDSLGPFGSLDALQRVKGIGPALARGLAPHVTFSSGFRPLHGESPARRPP